MSSVAPVIAIDGPAASGKGTVAQAVAQQLQFHYLDSGAIYRAAALAIDMADSDAGSDRRVECDAAAIAARMRLEFRAETVWLDGKDVTQLIRSEHCGSNASKIAALPPLRAALLDYQRGFRRAPGLVAEGRDMGSVIFPDAVLKVFLKASVAVRAARRHKQLMEKGINATIENLSAQIADRDARDQARSVAPLRSVSDAIVIDSTELSLPEVVELVIKNYFRLVR